MSTPRTYSASVPSVAQSGRIPDLAPGFEAGGLLQDDDEAGRETSFVMTVMFAPFFTVLGVAILYFYGWGV